MEIIWNCQASEEIFKSFRGLIGLNKGFFKTPKQADFLYNRRSMNGDVDMVYRMFGIKMEAGHKAIDVNAISVHCEYGARARRPMGYIFIIDEFGIVAQYRKKIIALNDGRSGYSERPGQHKLEFSREGEIPETLRVKSEEFKVEKEKVSSEFFGEVGSRQTITGVLTFSRAVSVNSWGVSYLNKILVNGKDEVVYFGKPFGFDAEGETDGNIGKTVSLVATIKEHKEFGGKRQTVIQRPAKVSIG